MFMELIHNTSHAKEKASTSKQTCLGLLLGLKIELVLCFDFVLLTPSLSTGPLSEPLYDSSPVILQ